MTELFHTKPGEPMTVFHADLDNTLIYSYKRGMDVPGKWVEQYQGRDISFMTEMSWRLLKQVRSRVLFVPTTTRTVEQYQRITFGTSPPEYALVCNGGVLLINGERDEDWYQESRALTADCREELYLAEQILKRDEQVTFEVRNIEELFVFTKSAGPKETMAELKTRLDERLVEISSHGEKIYILPRKLSKGEGVKRFRDRVHSPLVIAAGDSRFDISMLEEADIALAENSLRTEHIRHDSIFYPEKGRWFSEFVLEYVKDFTE